jgi:ankyrin repeat protein
MLDNGSYGPASKYDREKYAPLPELLLQAWLGEIGRIPVLGDRVLRHNLLNQIDPATGMNALHIAVGRGNLELTRLLIEAGIKIIPDKEGRMPSLIAGICRVSDELADYIAEAESRALQAQGQEDV